jgi:hypothetical protein
MVDDTEPFAIHLPLFQPVSAVGTVEDQCVKIENLLYLFNLKISVSAQHQEVDWYFSLRDVTSEGCTQDENPFAPKNDQISVDTYPGIIVLAGNHYRITDAECAPTFPQVVIDGECVDGEGRVTDKEVIGPSL